MMNIIWRLVRAGLVAALVVGLGGWAYERAHFGASDADALGRIEAELRRRFAASADSLGRIAAGVAVQRAAIQDAPRDPAAARRLFDAVDVALPDEDVGLTGLTVYDATGTALAWGGRVSELPKTRLAGPAALFAAPSALGPRLVRVEPVLDPGRSRDRRVVIVATAGVILTLAAARLVFWFAAAPLVGPRTLTSPLDLLLNALVVAALAWVALDLIERRRVTSPRPSLMMPNGRL